MSKLTLFTPHLLKANKQWLEENRLRVYITVKGEAITDKQLRTLIKDNTLTINISEGAVTQLVINQTGIHFVARFSGVPYPLSIPLDALIQLYTPDNLGIKLAQPQAMLKVDLGRAQTKPKAESNVSSITKKKPHLTIVKD